MSCGTCGRELRSVEIGLSKKLVNRGTQVCWCVDCLAKRFRQPPEKLLALADYFRRTGCSLF